MVLSDDFNGPYVQVDGAAEVIDLPDAARSAGRVLPRHRGRALRLGRVPAAMVDQGKCLLRVIPQRWGPIATGGFPPS